MLDGTYYDILDQKEEERKEAEASSMLYRMGSYFTAQVYSNTLGYLVGDSSQSDKNTKAGATELIDLKMVESRATNILRWFEENRPDTGSGILE